MMIQTPTTFVIGAGASCNHGLPTGESLKTLALKVNPGHDVFQLLLQCKIPLEHLHRTLDELKRDTGAPSIDAFLEPRQHRPDVMLVGRALIAALLGQILVKPKPKVERQAKALTDDWLGYVIVRMSYVKQCARPSGRERAVPFSHRD